MKNSFLYHTTTVLILALTGIILSGSKNNEKSSTVKLAKIYVANEGDASVSVINFQDSLNDAVIDMMGYSGEMYMPHKAENLQLTQISNYLSLNQSFLMSGWRHYFCFTRTTLYRY